MVRLGANGGYLNDPWHAHQRIVPFAEPYEVVKDAFRIGRRGKPFGDQGFSDAFEGDLRDPLAFASEMDRLFNMYTDIGEARPAEQSGELLSAIGVRTALMEQLLIQFHVRAERGIVRMGEMAGEIRVL